ncbi:LysR family transcriptional regulator, partial [Ralstonia solanacearum]
MEWNDWETFCRVVEAGSFTAAAEALGIPKSSASAAVSRLEASLGVRLLTRTTRQLRLTEAGSHFYDDIAPLFERLREVHADTTAASETVSGTLRIAAPYEVGAQHLTEPVCQTLARFPNLQIQVHISWEQPDLLASGYDIVFVMVDQTLADSSLVARRVVMIPRALYAAPSLLAGRAPLAAPADLSGWPCLSGRR